LGHPAADPFPQPYGHRGPLGDAHPGGDAEHPLLLVQKHHRSFSHLDDPHGLLQNEPADELRVEDGPQRPADLVQEVDLLIFVQNLRREAVEFELVFGHPRDEAGEEGNRLGRPPAAPDDEAQPLSIDLDGGRNLPLKTRTRLLGAAGGALLRREAPLQSAAELGPPGLGDYPAPSVQDEEGGRCQERKATRHFLQFVLAQQFRQFHGAIARLSPKTTPSSRNISAPRCGRA